MAASVILYLGSIVALDVHVRERQSFSKFAFFLLAGGGLFSQTVFESLRKRSHLLDYSEQKLCFHSPEKGCLQCVKADHEHGRSFNPACACTQEGFLKKSTVCMFHYKKAGT